MLLLSECLRALLIIVLAFEIFLISYDTITNITSSLHKDLESSNLLVSKINLSFFRNVLNYLALDFLIIQKKLHSESK